MFRRCLLALFAALLLTQTALAGEAANFEISSYVLYMTVQDNGDVRVREEIIYNNHSAYEGLSLPVSLEGTDGFDGVEAWCDGEPLEELSHEAARDDGTQGFAVSQGAEGGIIDIVFPGAGDSHAFACAYTLKGLAVRYQDTALLERVLIPAEREVMLQNAVAILVLPGSDGEILAYVDGAPEEIPVLIKYDTVNIGPLDVAADESLSMQLLFPADWLSEAETVPRRMRSAVIAPRRKAEAETAREVNARRAEQYTAIAVYGAAVVAALLILMKKYGVKGHAKGSLDEATLEKYPAALAVYAAQDKAGDTALTGTLLELAQKGIVSVRKDEDDRLRLRLESRPADLLPHEAAALDVVFAEHAGEEVDVERLYTPGDYEQAQRLCQGVVEYNKAVAADAHKAGLTWNNDAILIAAAFLNVLCGVILGFVLLLVGKRMILEACGVAVFMLVMVGQFNRVRSLTDEGERLQCSAEALGGATEADREALSRHWPLAAALSKAGEIKSEEASLGGELRERLHAAYYGAATLRRSRKK